METILLFTNNRYILLYLNDNHIIDANDVCPNLTNIYPKNIFSRYNHHVILDVNNNIHLLVVTELTIKLYDNIIKSKLTDQIIIDLYLNIYKHYLWIMIAQYNAKKKQFYYEQITIEKYQIITLSIKQYNSITKCNIINGFYVVLTDKNKLVLLHDNIKSNNKLCLCDNTEILNVGTYYFCCLRKNILYTGYYEGHGNNKIIQCGYKILNLLEHKVKQFYCVDNCVLFIDTNNELYIKYISHNKFVFVDTLDDDYVMQSIEHYILLVNKKKVLYVDVHQVRIYYVDYNFDVSFVHGIDLNNFIWNRQNHKFLDINKKKIILQTIMCNKFTKYHKIPYYVLQIIVNKFINH